VGRRAGESWGNAIVLSIAASLRAVRAASSPEARAPACARGLSVGHQLDDPRGIA
jgi:hypothetical protein